MSLSQTLFNIDLKVANQIMTLSVQSDDKMETLLNKFETLNNEHYTTSVEISSDQRQRLRHKIIQSIKLYLKQLQTKSIKLRLKQNNQKLLEKVRSLLKDEEKRQQITHKQNISNKKSAQKSKYTPFKALQEKTSEKQKQNRNLTFSRSQNKADRKHYEALNQQHPSQDLNTTTNAPNNKCLGKLSSNKRAQISRNKEYADKSLHNCSATKKSRKRVDDDLIVAYQTILKKSKDKVMREMAEKSLLQIMGSAYVASSNVKPAQEGGQIQKNHKPQKVQVKKSMSRVAECRPSFADANNLSTTQLVEQERQKWTHPSKNTQFESRPLSREHQQQSGKKSYSYTSFMNQSAEQEPVSLVYQYYEEEKLKVSSPYTYGHFQTNGMYAETSSFASLHKSQEPSNVGQNGRRFQYFVE